MYTQMSVMVNPKAPHHSIEAGALFLTPASITAKSTINMRAAIPMNISEMSMPTGPDEWRKGICMPAKPRKKLRR